MSDREVPGPPGGDTLSELARLGGSSELDGFLSRNPELVSPAIVEQIGDLVRQRVRVDVDEALRLAEAAVAIAALLSDGASLGRSYRAKANALWFKGNCKAAVDLFDKAAAAFNSASMPEEVGRTFSSSIQPLVLLGEYERAAAAAAEARQIFTRLGDNWRTARVELNSANIHHRQDRFAEALTGYERAYDELLPYKDAEGLGVAMHNMAVCLIMLNDFDRALTCYQRVRELCRSNDMPLLELQADYNIAYLYFLRGEYDLAIEGLSRTRERSRANGDAYHLALCDLDEAEIYLELNLSNEAARMADKARRQFETLGMAFETGRSVANLAIATHRQMNSPRAIELFAAAKGIFEREDNDAWQALINLYHAMVLCESRRYDEARDLCIHARAFFTAVGLERRETICDLLLARISLETGDVADCRSYCQTILRSVDALQAPSISFQAYLLLGNAEHRSGDWKSAYSSYNDARAQLETLRNSVQGEELKISFIKDKVDVYRSLVEVCLDPRSGTPPEVVFHYIEQAKSRSLAELVFGRTRRVGWGDAPAPVAGNLRELKGELNWIYHRIELEQTSRDGVSTDRIEKLREDARRKEDDFLRAIRTLEGTSGRSNALHSTISLEVKEVQAALPPGAAIVEYFQTQDDFIAVVLQDNRTEIIQLAPVREVSAHIQMLEFQLSKFRLASSYPKEFQTQLIAATQNRLRELYRDLFEPLSSLLTGSHLIIVPHGILHYLPFHALFDGEHYLIDRWTISFAPSASIYTMCHQKAANSVGGSLLMGVQDANAPFIEDEVRSVASVVQNARVVLGQDATAEVLRREGPGSRLIHLATHGFFRRDNALFSSVRLADSYLTLYDLYDLNLPVELLTLSGCGTGLNVVAPGDELLGLTRGLLCAGAQTVLLTLWDVHDRTTAEFMASFYTHLEAGQQKASALRLAMLETRERQPHPYFWAPFVMVGKALNNPTVNS